MNIENIDFLAGLLKSIGLDGNIGKELLRHACFLPSDFTLVKHLAKQQDVLTCSFQFVRVKDEYACSYYEAALLKNIEVSDRVIESIHVRDLEIRMAAINWNIEERSSNDFNLQDQATWKCESEIEQVVKDLIKISSTDEGKYIADVLKVKYWPPGSRNFAFENLNSVRAKFEISQRFYFSEGQVISIEEAYRFLLNRWIEKEHYLRHKRILANSQASKTANMPVDNSNAREITANRKVRKNKSK